MNTLDNFAHTLEKHIGQSEYSLRQLARLSGVPFRTIANWMEGRVKKPRNLDCLLKLLATLKLEEHKTTQLLQTIGYPSIRELQAKAKLHQDQNLEDLLMFWSKSKTQAPFQVIPDLPYFVGRAKELETIDIISIR